MPYFTVNMMARVQTCIVKYWWWERKEPKLVVTWGLHGNSQWTDISTYEVENRCQAMISYIAGAHDLAWQAQKVSRRRTLWDYLSPLEAQN